MLSVFDEILQRLVHIGSARSVAPQDEADTTLIAIPLLVMVTAVRVALTMRDVLPEFAQLDGLVDIPTYLVAIEEIGSMDVVPPTIFPVALLDYVDVADKVLEDRIAFVRSNQLLQVTEHVLNAQPGLHLRTVMEVGPNDGEARIALT